MIYEYDTFTLDLSEDKKQSIQLGFGDIDELNVLLKDVINKKALDGWEPLYPFSVPHIWFKRLKKPTKQKK